MSASSQPTAPMTVDQARAVLWLRNKNRPLGELLDSGYLTPDRLGWAAEKAYNPMLKQASAVLLAHVQAQSARPAQRDEQASPLALGITLKQARETRWPFRPMRGRLMGELYDSERINGKDLGYALENAWDDRVRRAAALLLAMRLERAVEEPPPSAGPLQVVSGGSSYARQKELQLTMLQGILLGAAASSVVWILILTVRGWLGPSRNAISETLASPARIVAALILLALGGGLGWLINRLLGAGEAKIDRELDAYRKGQEGEERVVELARETLDGSWTLFRNVQLPGRNKGDLDAVLVGPPGVWALEIKAFSGAYRNVGSQWWYRAGGQWVSYKGSPSQQAKDNATRLGEFLRADGLSTWVKEAVVWADPESSLSVENPMAAVWTLDRLPEELGNVWQEKPREPEEVDRVKAKLEALCARQRTEAE